MKNSKPNNKYNQKGRKSTRGGKPKNSNSRNEGSKSKEEEFKGNTNDPAWYAKNPQLLRDVASVSFGWLAGRPIPLATNTELFPNRTGDLRIPGICALYTIPTFPYTEGSNDALNVAGMKQYSYLRHALSANLPYDMPELICMEVAMAQVYSYINFLRRAYAVASLYANENRYVPQGLLYAMGIDAEDLQTNLNNFRTGINMLTVKASALSVPADLTYFSRQAMMYANIYTAGTSIKDQLYMYVPKGFFVLKETTDTGVSLELTMLNDALNAEQSQLTWDQLIDFGRFMLNPILASQDMGLISSNILRVYGSNGILKLSTTPEILDIVPVFDIGVLEQMANAQVLDWELAQDMFSKGNLDVTQQIEEEYLQFALSYTPKVDLSVTTDLSSQQLTSLKCGTYLKQLLTTTTAFTDPNLVIESTRMKFGINYEKKASGTEIYKFDFATEVVTNIEFWNISKAAVPGVAAYSVTSQSYTYISAYAGAQVPLPSVSLDSYETELVSIRNYFRYAPQLFFIVSNGTVTAFGAPVTMFDVDNYTIIESDNLAMMNEVATLSMLDAPGVAMKY